MSVSNLYLGLILDKYKGKDLTTHSYAINHLKGQLQSWAQTCYVDILTSGSCAKGTAISLSSDVDLMVSLTPECHKDDGGLKRCYDSLFTFLASEKYAGVRKQNVSVRIEFCGLEIDVTPARQMTGYQNYHSLYVSKTDSWKQTNIKMHINDVSMSGRLDEIRLLKIWREKHQIDFPSIYLEYLTIKHLLFGKSKAATNLADNFYHCLCELAKNEDNPLLKRVDDPANTNNILSDLLTFSEKQKIFQAAQVAISENDFSKIVS